MGWADSVLGGTAGAPWLWWAAALVVLLVVLYGLLKVMGVWPD